MANAGMKWIRWLNTGSRSWTLGHAQWPDSRRMLCGKRIPEEAPVREIDPAKYAPCRVCFSAAVELDRLRAHELMAEKSAAFDWLEQQLSDNGYGYAKGFSDPKIDTLCLSLWIDCRQPTLLEAIKAEMDKP